MAKVFRAIARYYSLLGLRGVTAWIYARISGRRPLLSKTVTGFEHPVYLRIGTTDPAVFRQVFVERHYDFPAPTAATVIVDAGANIGLSAVFFANKFPGATIVAIEPAEANFNLLVKNALPFPQIKPLMAALWKQDGTISLIDPGEGDHGFQTINVSDVGTRTLGLVRAITLDALMKEMKLDHIDILKIDIEGSEKEVFENSSHWIGKVGVVMAELHDHAKPGCTEAFVVATSGFSQEMSKGETIVRLRTAHSDSVRKCLPA